eukprot:4738727-Pleurochrysis_carterae.AAC.1
MVEASLMEECAARHWLMISTCETRIATRSVRARLGAETFSRLPAEATHANGPLKRPIRHFSRTVSRAARRQRRSFMRAIVITRCDQRELFRTPFRLAHRPTRLSNSRRRSGSPGNRARR